MHSLLTSAAPTPTYRASQDMWCSCMQARALVEKTNASDADEGTDETPCALAERRARRASLLRIAFALRHAEDAKRVSGWKRPEECVEGVRRE